MPNCYVAIVGSRCISDDVLPLVDRVVLSLLRAGHSISVGCSAGVDAAVIRAALAHGGAGSLQIHAICDPAGRGAWRGTAFRDVSQASQACARVEWLAGGDLPAQDRQSGIQRELAGAFGGGMVGAVVDAIQEDRELGGRLTRRTRVVVASAGRLVAIITSPKSRGSLAAVDLAVASHMPALVFPIGFDESEIPVSMPGGVWVVAGGSGVWAGAVRFSYPPDIFGITRAA